MVVINSSPVIVLAKMGKLELLHKLFGIVSITEQVYEEILAKPSYSEAITIKKSVEDGWVKVHKANEINDIIGKGEASSIGLALKFKEPLIIDDKKAVFIANTFEIECHGTLYIILLALKKRIIKDKKEAIEILNDLSNNNFYLSSEALTEFYTLLSKIGLD